MAKFKKYPEELYQSEYFLYMLKDMIDHQNVSMESKNVLKKIELLYPNLKKEIVSSFPSAFSSRPDVVLYLTDKRDVRIFKIHITEYGDIRSISEHFDTLKKKDNLDITKLLPLVKEKLKISGGRVYYDKDDQVFELRLWTLFALKINDELIKHG